MERFLVAKKSDYEALKSRLEKVSPGKGNWETYYRDPTTGEEWREFYPDSDRWWSYPPCLMKLPRPSDDELIEIACTIEDDDEAAVASLLAAQNPEVLGKFMERLERMSKGADRWVCERVGRIIRCASLEWTMNRRPTHGKPYTEVEADHKHFQQIAERARQLREAAEKAVGHKFEKDLSSQ